MLLLMLFDVYGDLVDGDDDVVDVVVDVVVATDRIRSTT